MMKVNNMLFTVYNSQGIPVYTTFNKVDAQTFADFIGGYYKFN